MAADKSSPLVPKLRFAAFRDAGDWEETTLGEVLKIGNGRDHKHLPEGEFPVYGTGGYMRSVNDYLYDGESVCIGRKGTIDKPMFLEGKFWTVDTLFYTHSFKDCLARFIHLIFLNIPWQKYNEASGVPSLSKTTIEDIGIFFPKISEQQKISDCLGSLDGLIAAGGERLEALRQHKQGLMQQLFPQPKKTTPHLRFAEFRDAGDWEEVTLGEVLEIENGRDHKHLSEGDFAVYGTGGYMRSVNDYLHDGESVCIGRKGTIDKPMFLEGKFWTVDTLFYTHSFKDCLARFIYLIFLNIPWKKYNEASGVPSLSKTTIEDIGILFPKVSEQQKIANCLNSLDDLIAAEDKKLETLRQHKQGLLQQLFPNMEV